MWEREDQKDVETETTPLPRPVRRKLESFNKSFMHCPDEWVFSRSSVLTMPFVVSWCCRDTRWASTGLSCIVFTSLGEDVHLLHRIDGALLSLYRVLLLFAWRGHMVSAWALILLHGFFGLHGFHVQHWFKHWNVISVPVLDRWVLGGNDGLNTELFSVGWPCGIILCYSKFVDLENSQKSLTIPANSRNYCFTQGFHVFPKKILGISWNSSIYCYFSTILLNWINCLHWVDLCNWPCGTST